MCGKLYNPVETKHRSHHYHEERLQKNRLSWCDMMPPLDKPHQTVKRMRRGWLHIASFDRTTIRKLFQEYGVESRQWHRECWPSNAQLSLFFNGTQ